jgi:glycosyltransferase involved in cell wall biosynthesis
MRIGIDATAVPPKPMGAGLYIVYLIRELGKLDSLHEFVVFAQEYLRPNLEGSVDRQLQIVWLKNMSRPRRLTWEQTVFPRLIREMGLDLLHSPHYTMPLFCPVPTVVTFHDMTYFIYPEKHTLAKRYFFPWMMRRSSRRADKIIADSESTRQDAIRFVKVPPDKITTVHLGYNEIFRQITDQEMLQEIEQQYHLPDRFVFYAGAFEPRKNVPLLLNAFEQIASKHADLHLVVTGGTGWNNQETLAQIDRMQSKDRIIRLGHIPHADLPAIFNLAEVFVYPSLYEGFGLPPLEGLACGTPVITTNISSMPEVVGNAGILVPPDEEAALVQAMTDVLTDDDLRQRLSAAGPVRAANFTWRHTAEKTLKIYEQVLDV